jgi:hypothetical protein
MVQICDVEFQISVQQQLMELLQKKQLMELRQKKNLMEWTK